MHSTIMAPPSHSRNHSLSDIPGLGRTNSQQQRLCQGSARNSNSLISPAGTFAPLFIQQSPSANRTDLARTLPRQGQDVRNQQEQAHSHGLDGENDFSGKRYVWVRDAEAAFVRGYVVQDQPSTTTNITSISTSTSLLRVQCDDGTQRDVPSDSVDKVNPAKFDRADDMAELTHLNEASVVHNLRQRYMSDLIYTYSGLFLVTVNPYTPLPIYGRDYVDMYNGRTREDAKPHIFAVADEAFRKLVEEGTNQSILVTGESGAGKTENTKKVIQYLAAVAVATTSITPRSNYQTKARQQQQQQHSNLSEQILRANPILEAFGNAQTVRNNNSSRFGKFIRIEFTRSGQIAGAFIDWYLLEKSRVVRLNSHERNYHVFYQLLRGADKSTRQACLLENDASTDDFEYLHHGNDTITGVSDLDEWNLLHEAFCIMGFSPADQKAILQTLAAVLHLGNIGVVQESVRDDQAALAPDAEPSIHKACQLLGISDEAFTQALLHPRVRAGHEWVEKAQTASQARLAIDALAKGIYERGFGDLVARLNTQLSRTTTSSGVSLAGEPTSFIGVLDIAGFEIFEHNGFEQLCINHTNERLQQFFNHHMFVLEQEEYAREAIEWAFIDFGRDLQPAIDLIELSQPVGIFSCLDEDAVMPRATDASFTEKLHGLWGDGKSHRYRKCMRTQGFMLTHYAAEVEYDTHGWLEKNKDPLSDGMTRLLAASSRPHVADLFADCAADPSLFDDATTLTLSGPAPARSMPRPASKRSLFRTVAQRHKEQLSTLMTQLHATHPHFVRCILPNHSKRPKLFAAPLVLDQLRCNGVLEGIRIARTGFPNRLPFAEFRARYEVLCRDLPRHLAGAGAAGGQEVCRLMLEKLNLDRSWYRVGLTKVFFRAGVLAELEEARDALIREIIARFQCVARGFVQRRLFAKQRHRAEAAEVIARHFAAYIRLQRSPWWRLFERMRPLLGATRTGLEVKRREEEIARLKVQMAEEAETQRMRVEEEKRRAEIEMQRVRQTLESERALALDKEEILRRAGLREEELEVQLQGTVEEQEELEKEVDALVAARREVEALAEERRRQVEQAGGIIEKLESEKVELVQRIQDVQVRLNETEKTRSMRGEQEEALQRELRMLQSQISLKDRKVQDLEARLLANEQELDIQLAAATKDLHSTKKQLRDLFDENRAIRQQMADLSTTSASFEDVIRRKDSELAILKTDLRKYEDDRRRFDDEKHDLTTRHDTVQTRLRSVQAEMEAVQTQHAQLSREVTDAKRALEAHMSSNAQAEMLEAQLRDVKAELFQTQTDLSRERQSRDDVKSIAAAELDILKRDFDALNESKVTIEKEMYAQSDVTRRATAAREQAEKERREYQAELQALRKQFIELQEAKIEAEATVQRDVTRAANERHALTRRELDAKAQQIEELDGERTRLGGEVAKLKRLIGDSDNFKLHHDQDKQRLERELVTIKGRLAASENDNRSLLNKVQQKNLDLARSHSQAADSQRVRLNNLASAKAHSEDEVKALQRKLEDVQLLLGSVEKQKEKLALAVEDANHEAERERKTARAADQASSAAGLQLADANRKLETERQLRAQAQQNTRTVQAALDTAHKELEEAHKQLHLLQKVFDPDTGRVDALPSNIDGTKESLKRTVDLAKRLEQSENALRVASDRFARAEAMLDDLRAQHNEDLQENDARFASSKRALLEEMNGSQINARASPAAATFRPWSEERKLYTPGSNHGTPATTAANRRQISKTSNDSARSDRTVDTLTYNNRMDLAAELEQVQNQLQMSEMHNRHLQAQVERSSPSKNGSTAWQEEENSPSLRRVQKLERENFRLHDMLDDSAKKVSALEHSIRTGQLGLKEVQTKSHEELYELITSQEQSRRSLLGSHNAAVMELAEAKTSFDEVKMAKAGVEVELRDAKSELNDTHYEREREAANHAQLLQEFAELQIRLDGEASRLVDVTSSLNLYKARADEYFAKLEQAEIAVLKASRAEQFAKTQAREAEETSAGVLAERKAMEGLVEDLQRTVQRCEEKFEDVSTDLDAALQAKKRLQNELEDYRAQRAGELESKESSMEQTRKKYQQELAALTGELEVQRDNVMHARGENGRLRDEVEELRGKWDDEVLNSSTWAKEKSRLEVALQGLADSRDEAVAAHNEAQGRIVDLLGQVRGLRGSVDDAAAERDLLLKEKKSLEARLGEAAERLEDLSTHGTPARRDAASLDREMLGLKARLAQQEDIAAAAVGKMRRADGLVQEVQRDIASARETSALLHREKAGLEKTVKDLQLRCIDLETKGYSSGSQDVRFLHGRVQELETQLEHLEQTRTTEARTVRNVDRTVKDLQTQIERRDKSAQLLSEDLNKSRDKIERLLTTIDELQQADSSAQLSTKRAERELREEREKSLRLEREVEVLRAGNRERELSLRRSGTLAALSDDGGRGGSRRGSSMGLPPSLSGEVKIEVPARKSSLTKGFL